MLSVIMAGITGIITLGGLALFLKSGKSILKWGGLCAFGLGLLFFLVGFPVIPSP